jgi:hypothetical protein
MSRTLSTTLVEAVLSQETKEIYLILLTISSDDLSYDLRFVNNYEDVVSGGETFLGFPFQISLPHDEERRLPSVKLIIDNVAREIIDEIRTLTTPPTVQMDIILASDPDTIEDGPYILTLREANWDRLTISGRLQGDDILNQKYGEQFTPQNAPGLFP